MLGAGRAGDAPRPGAALPVVAPSAAGRCGRGGGGRLGAPRAAGQGAAARLQPSFAGAERGARPFGWLEAPDPAGHSVIVQPAPHRVNNFPDRKEYI